MSRRTNPRATEAQLERLDRGDDGIYGFCENTADQTIEIEFRTRVAAKPYADYLAEVSRHHCIAVMDAEVARFLRSICAGGWIVDVGGGLGWHWRNVHVHRPDVRVVIVDFVRDNLKHARRLLGSTVDKNVFLVHGNATQLNLPDESFDGYWSVQTLQHVPEFEAAVRESHRVLRPGGHFSLYSLNDAAVVRLLRWALGRPFHRAGHIPGAFYLERMTRRHAQTLALTFGREPTSRYTELLFNPDLGLRAAGAVDSRLGRIDACLSGSGRIRALWARQHSLHVRKAPTGSGHG